MKIVKKSLTALAVSALMLGTVSAGTLILSTEVVYAKGNDKNDDRGNSGNNGRSDKGNNNKGGSSNSKNASNKSTSGQGGGFFGLFKKKNKQPTQQTASVAPTTTVPTAKPAKAVNRGALASELKGLNAAHANPNALKNASPDSMVGKVAAYQTAVHNAEALELLEADLVLLEETLAALEESYEGRDSETIQGEIDALNDEITAIEENADLTEEEKLEQIGDINDLITPLEDELVLAKTHEDAVSVLNDDIAEVGTQIEELEAEQSPEEALAIATGDRDLSYEALVELHVLLGLTPPEPEAEDGATSGDTGETPTVQ